MSRITGWFRSSGKQEKPISTPTPEKELDNLLDAMKWVELIMNDDIDGAWKNLQQGDSSFHQLGESVTFFLRSILGFEKSVMVEANAKLAACEARAWADHKQALKMGSSGNRVYPPGTEYELVVAETQLMGAVVGVLHESLVEGMKSFYKLRKAFFTLENIVAVETQEQARRLAARHNSTASLSRQRYSGSSQASDAGSDSNNSELSTAPTTPDMELPEISFDENTTSRLLRLQEQVDRNREMKFDNPMDEFIHTGVNMCLGILHLVLSLVPPSFSRILSVVGFKGDRPRAIKMLWSSASKVHINGAISGMMLLAYYNGYLGAADILPDENDYDEDAEVVGAPKQKCEALLTEMRARYPDSRLWRMEESRMLANDRKVERAIDLLMTGKDSNMKQLVGMSNFELSIDALIAQNWTLMRDQFLHCLEVNDWSASTYYFMIGCATLELYRDAFHAGDAAEAKAQKAKAEELFRKVPANVGKKRFLSRQMPLEGFVQRKLQKWEARAKALGIDLADAIGPSPAMEMCYFWNGSKRMDTAQLEKGVEHLKWERCTAEPKVVEAIKAEADEMAIWAVGMAALLRSAGKLDEAMEMLEKHVLAFDKPTFKGGNKDDYVLAAATYETGVIAWLECCNPPPGASEEETLEYRRWKMLQVEARMNMVRDWEAFVLDSRISIRAQSGLETLAWFKKRMGWE